MELKPIRNEKDYKQALARLEDIFDSPMGTRENEIADVLVTLIDKYESVAYPIDDPDPVEAIKIRMKEMDLTQTDLMHVTGSKSRGTISNVLNYNRPLTLPLIRKLGPSLGIPYAVLIQEYFSPAEAKTG